MVRVGYYSNNKDDHYTFLKLDTLSEDVRDKEINNICFTPTLVMGALDNKIVFTDSKQPLVLIDNFFFKNTIGIEYEFYKEHKEEIEKQLIEIIRHKKDSIRIESTELITDAVIQAIIDNKEITHVMIGEADEPFVLTTELYKKFKEAGKVEVRTYAVAEELKDNFDLMIGYNARRYLVGCYTYKSLQETNRYYLSQELEGEELANLRFLNRDAEVIIKYDSVKNVMDVIRVLNEVNSTRKIVIDIEDKNEFNKYFFTKINEMPNTNNIFIRIGGNTYDYRTYLGYEKRLMDLVLPVANLSPFEQYLYIYDIVNKYKKYKENEEDRNSARDLYRLLDNEYMVCVGYAELLVDLLSKVGIRANRLSVQVDVGLDYVPIDTMVLPDFIGGKTKDEIYEVKTKEAGHARVFVDLVDPKYGIDGYYLADPTWDNVMDNHSFNYALMTHDEYITTDRYNYLSLYGVTELFFIHSLEEFYQKINLILDKNSMMKEEELLRRFEEFYEKSNGETIQDKFLEIGEHILDKTNNVITPTMYRACLSELIKRGLIKKHEDKSVEEEVSQIMNYNKKRQEICFPIRYIILRDGTKRPLFNMTNKFDEGIESPNLEVAAEDMIRK